MTKKTLLQIAKSEKKWVHDERIEASENDMSGEETKKKEEKRRANMLK